MPVSGPGGTNQPFPAPALHDVRSIRSLPPARAALRLPVQLRGVITYADPGWQHYFIQDATGGIYVRSWQEGLRAGQLVELNGWTAPGKTVRMLVNASVRQLGQTNFPASVRVTAPELSLSTNESRWVELEGVVRAMSSVPARMTLKLSTTNGEVEAVIQGPSKAPELNWLLDTTVKVQGVSAVTINSREEVAGAQLRVPGRQCLQVLQKAPTNAFAIEPRPIGQVSSSSPAELGLHRVRVQGVVTLKGSGGDFFLQDGSGAVRVRTTQQDDHPPGKWLDVVGFPVADAFGSRLHGAIFRYDKPATAPAPQTFSASDLRAVTTHHNELVQLDGQLLNDAGGSTLPLLLVQNGAVVFQARFAIGDALMPAPPWLAGSRLRLTGVCDLEVNPTNRPRTFVLLLRTPADVQVLAPPPRWTPQEAWNLAGGLAVVSLAILGWVVLLRRTVARQTGQIRQRLEAEAGLEKQLMLVWETSAEGNCMTDAQGRIARVNDAYCRMIGKPRAELEGQLFTMVLAAGSGEATLDTYRRQFAERKNPLTEELELTLWDGRRVWLESSNSFFEHPPFPIMLLSQFRDVTRRKQSEALLKTALSDKDVLLREVHHRVKNNLAVITGLLNLQRRALQDPASRTVLQDLTTRIQSMSLVHEQLYRAENLSSIGFQDYLETLVAQLVASLGRKTNVDCRVVTNGLQLSLETAIPCGLIVNELLTNALKHAFPAGRPRDGAERCIIEISLRQHESALILAVADNGLGLPEDAELAMSKSLGLRLVQTIGQHQLGGQVALDRSQGTRVTLTFQPKQ